MHVLQGEQIHVAVVGVVEGVLVVEGPVFVVSGIPIAGAVAVGQTETAVVEMLCLVGSPRMPRQPAMIDTAVLSELNGGFELPTPGFPTGLSASPQGQHLVIDTIL